MDKTLETVGHLLATEQGRDAVHFALAPVRAAGYLVPGAHVALVGTSHEGDPLVDLAEPSEGVGIIDPFLAASVNPHERCWLFLYPATITSLRHEWSHPAFAPSAPQQRMEEIAARVGMAYPAFMGFLREGQLGRSYLSFGDDEESASYCNSASDEIWEHYGALTGTTITRRPYFSCTC